KRIQFTIDRQIEMRNSLLRFHQTAGNRLAHAVVRNDFVGAFLKELENGIVRHRLWSGSGDGFGLRRSGLYATRRQSSFHIPLNDTSMRTGALHSSNIDTGFLGNAARERRRKHPVTLVRSSRLLCLGWCRGCHRRGSWLWLFLRSFGLCFSLRGRSCTLGRSSHVLAFLGEDGDQRIDLDAF